MTDGDLGFRVGELNSGWKGVPLPMVSILYADAGFPWTLVELTGSFLYDANECLVVYKAKTEGLSGSLEIVSYSVTNRTRREWWAIVRGYRPDYDIKLPTDSKPVSPFATSLVLFFDKVWRGAPCGATRVDSTTGEAVLHVRSSWGDGGSSFLTFDGIKFGYSVSRFGTFCWELESTGRPGCPKRTTFGCNRSEQPIIRLFCQRLLRACGLTTTQSAWNKFLSFFGERFTTLSAPFNPTWDPSTDEDNEDT
jgi:hypothetical protein